MSSVPRRSRRVPRHENLWGLQETPVEGGTATRATQGVCPSLSRAGADASNTTGRRGADAAIEANGPALKSIARLATRSATLVPPPPGCTATTMPNRGGFERASKPSSRPRPETVGVRARAQPLAERDPGSSIAVQYDCSTCPTSSAHGSAVLLPLGPPESGQREERGTVGAGRAAYVTVAVLW